MVVQRTLNKIEELKERPHHERHAIAKMWGIGVAALLLVLWGSFAVHRIGKTAMELTKQEQAAAAQAASAAASQGVQARPSTALVASSTNGYVDLVPAAESGR